MPNELKSFMERFIGPHAGVGKRILVAFVADVADSLRRQVSCGQTAGRTRGQGCIKPTELCNGGGLILRLFLLVLVRVLVLELLRMTAKIEDEEENEDEDERKMSCSNRAPKSSLMQNYQSDL